jgi:hypothetical protein
VEYKYNPPPGLSSILSYRSTYVSSIDDASGSDVSMDDILEAMLVASPEYNRDLSLFPIELLKPLNSPNHGGRHDGHGQSVARGDGSVDFMKTPLAGVDADNIYSLAKQEGAVASFNEQFLEGNYPGLDALNTVCPGWHAIDNTQGFPENVGINASTDTALYP